LPIRCPFEQVSDYGDVDKEEDFSYIYPYSPLHNVPEYENGFKGQFPAILLTTGAPPHTHTRAREPSLAFSLPSQHLAHIKLHVLKILRGKIQHGSGGLLVSRSLCLAGESG